MAGPFNRGDTIINKHFTFTFFYYNVMHYITNYDCETFTFILPLWDSVIVLCFVARYFVSILVLQSSRWGNGSWLLCFVCLPSVS